MNATVREARMIEQPMIPLRPALCQQPEPCCARLPNLPHMSLDSECRSEGCAPPNLPKSFFAASVSVSYTQLDVYKRQGYIQAAVRSQAPQDGLRRGYTSAATRGKKGHVITLQTGFGCFIIGSGSIIHGFGARVKPEMHEKGDGLSSRPPHHAKVQLT